MTLGMAASALRPTNKFAGPISRQSWSLADIRWQDCRPEAVRESAELFYLLTTASFVESTTHLYSDNLLDHYAGDDELTSWLLHAWRPEEIQHGKALAAYVGHVWPEFSWEDTYREFVAEFRQVCRTDLLLPRRSLELVSRCVVEMGTASLYLALSRISPDPVLTKLTNNIFEDEIRHYKYFYQFFLKYAAREPVGRWKIITALVHRLRMIEDEDTIIALKHVHGARCPGEPFTNATHDEIWKQCRTVSSRHFPHSMCVKMLLKPLRMPTKLQSLIEFPLETLIRRTIV